MNEDDDLEAQLDINLDSLTDQELMNNYRELFQALEQKKKDILSLTEIASGVLEENKEIKSQMEKTKE